MFSMHNRMLAWGAMIYGMRVMRFLPMKDNAFPHNGQSMRLGEGVMLHTVD
jgi:hypothetical protein